MRKGRARVNSAKRKSGKYFLCLKLYHESFFHANNDFSHDARASLFGMESVRDGFAYARINSIPKQIISVTDARPYAAWGRSAFVTVTDGFEKNFPERIN